jgi:hypothetical protein
LCVEDKGEEEARGVQFIPSVAWVMELLVEGVPHRLREEENP